MQGANESQRHGYRSQSEAGSSLVVTDLYCQWFSTLAVCLMGEAAEHTFVESALDLGCPVGSSSGSACGLRRFLPLVVFSRFQFLV